MGKKKFKPGIADPKLPHGSNFCQCPACKLYFGSPYPFDLHRVGKHGVDRRCLTTDEMLERGMFEDDRGYWRSKKREV